ncbi:hypothetical protein ONO86_05189 [Micromonospora noduli]|nr:hypothetical protein ONO86_05189 [Micromonospora noduli]
MAAGTMSSPPERAGNHVGYQPRCASFGLSGQRVEGGDRWPGRPSGGGCGRWALSVVDVVTWQVGGPDGCVKRLQC